MHANLAFGAYKDERTTEEGTPAAGSREFMTKVVCECNGKGDDMRLRNIPRAEGVLQAHPIVIKEENNQKGKWNQIFGNDHPIYIEIGMGKGQFLMTLAKQNPDINYIGIERYSSVLLRAVEKYEEFCGRDIVPGKEGDGTAGADRRSGTVEYPVCLHGCRSYHGCICAGRGSKDLSEFFGSMAEETACKKTSYFKRIFEEIRSDTGKRWKSRI